MRNYKNIKAHKLADELVKQVYLITRAFPKEEIYGLTSQLRRAAISIPTNIAEGASRRHKKDYLHFLYIARGSLAETEYLLGLSRDLNFLDSRKFDFTGKTLQEVAKTLFGLIGSVEKET